MLKGQQPTKRQDGELMTARPATFRQADITRAVKGARAAGLSVAKVEVDNGRITVIAATGEAATGPMSDLEKWQEQKGRGRGVR